MPVYLFDSFPAARFGGNVAGVVLLESDAPPEWMQGIARELGAPTTGFVNLPSARDGLARVRFFTPVQEIGACGHVTVAIATLLAEEGVWPAGDAAVTSPGGRFPLTLLALGGQLMVEMHHQLRHLQRLGDSTVARAVLGQVPPSDRLPLVLAGTGLRHLLVPVDSATDLSLLPLLPADIAAVSSALAVDTIGIFAVERTGRAGVSARMRDLCAGIGATEEPASGTTTAALAFALADMGLLAPGRNRLEAVMGVEMGRASRLHVELDYLGGRPARVRLRGSARRVLTGTVEAD